MTRCHLLGGIILCSASLLWAQNEQPGAHAALLEWVRTEKVISQEAADWQSEQAVLEDMVKVLEIESAQLEKQMAAVEATIANSTAKTEALATREAAIQTEISELAAAFPAWETEALATVNSWPAPLRAEVDSLTTLEAPADSKLDWLARAPSWLQVLQQADQLNRQVTLGVDTFTTADGSEWQVREIFFGFAGGFWTTADGGQGGVLIPAPEGWTRESNAAAAELAADMIAIAESRRPSVYLEGPVKVD
ncbi:DUF3450 family protein [Cerasicoccus maritimus]|uniref:DUF3450 family protein n=1 Tax=Cerasicoccus maritimus TaxID=490089 RepID=UPI0028528963|nr:DUF3450 family protein [Cerasicoccus maritimus]